MKAFIFDMDGVLIDTQPIHTQAICKALSEYGFSSTTAEIDRYAGTSRGVAFADYAQRHGISLPVEEITQRKEAIFDALLKTQGLKPIEGIVPLLKDLRTRGIRTAIASSSGDDFISFVVDQLKIRSYFDALLSGENLPKSKPDPAIYRWAAKTLETAPEDCVVLEDACLGIEAAKGAGIFAIGFRNPHSGKQDLSKADLIVDRIQDIPLDRL